MPTGYTAVSATNLCDATGTVIANATISFKPVDNKGNTISFRAGGSGQGQASFHPVTATVTNGAFSIVLADTTMTTPVNVGYAVTVIDNVSGDCLLSKGYECVQPSGATWSFDSYQPNFAAQITVQPGPQGLQGIPGANGVASLPSLAQIRAKLPSTPNLFNYATLIDAQYVSAVDGTLHTVPEEDAIFTTDFIPANAGGDMTASAPITGSFSSGIAFYDQNFNFVSGIYGSGQTTFTVPSGVAWVRASFTIVGSQSRSQMMIVNGDTLPSSFVSYTQMSAAEITAAITASVTGVAATVDNALTNGSSPSTIGTVLSAADSSVYSGTWGLSDTFTKAGFLSALTLRLGHHAPGVFLDVAICSGVITGTNGVFTPVAKFRITSSVTTTVDTNETFYAGTDFGEVIVSVGDYIFVTAVGATLAYNTSGESSVNFWNSSGVTAMPAVGTSFNAAQGGGALFGVSANVQAALAPISEPQATTLISNALASYVPPVSPSRHVTLLNESFTGTTLPSAWTTTGGTWTVNNGVTSPLYTAGNGGTQSALAPWLQCTNNYAVEEKIIRLRFHILTANTIVGVGSTDGDDSLITVDNVAHTLNIYDNGGGNILYTTPLGFTLTVGTTYTLIVYLNERELTATIGDAATGLVTSLHAGNNAIDPGMIGLSGGGLTGGTGGFGLVGDNLLCSVVLGQFFVENFSFLTNADSALHTVFQGDSITWGYLCTLAGRWVTKVGNLLPGAWLSSGRPGGASQMVLERMTTEMAILKPKYMVLMIGTNESYDNVPDYSGRINAIIADAVSQGTQVVICTVPCVNSVSGQAGTTAFNNYLLGLKGTAGVAAIVRADLATSVNNDGHTINMALYNTDGIHPNAAGGTAIFNRFLIDAPMLFD